MNTAVPIIDQLAAANARIAVLEAQIATLEPLRVAAYAVARWVPLWVGQPLPAGLDTALRELDRVVDTLVRES